ncbi:hypothetical protein [Actibacterium pelagium]|uniref:Uncharacterized protein n=1 Tax=Actibacterium pelagium TaxID=2029103 RepID=A0A917AP37_9RHOB|nr:hypothetical protein [Actibacterium pelagium]GGE61004.1 hypothetical protein GCM10011517_30700 [Actibacterium pelagium]
MRWGLLFDDIAARLFGLAGLYVCFLYANLVQQPVDPDLSTEFKAGLLLFTGAGALTYLIPSFHDSAIKISRGILGRIVFVLCSLAWGAVVAFGLEMSVRSGIGPIPAEFGRIAVSAMVFGFGAYVFLFLFPLGISYRYAANFGGQATYSPTTSGAYHPGSGRMPEPKMQVDIGPRNRDIFDFLLRLPLLAVLGVTAFAFLTDSVAPTLELDQMATKFLIPGMAAAALLILFKPVMTMLRRPIVDAQRMPALKKLLFVVLALPVFSVILFYSVTYHAIPWVWQKMNPAPEASLRYVVSKNGLNDVVDGCLGLHFQEAEDRAFTLCKLDAAITNDLLPGDVIEGTGSLSRYGHSMSALRVVSRVPRGPVAPPAPAVILDEEGNPIEVEPDAEEDAETAAADSDNTPDS